MPVLFKDIFEDLAPAQVGFPELPQPTPNEDPLVQMMWDRPQVLKKPLEYRRWFTVIDLRKCVGCHACIISCIANNKFPPGVIYRPPDSSATCVLRQMSLN